LSFKNQLPSASLKPINHVRNLISGSLLEENLEEFLANSKKSKN